MREATARRGLRSARIVAIGTSTGRNRPDCFTFPAICWVRFISRSPLVANLNTTGQVDAAAGIVDFAGSRGRVTLSAEVEINLKITAPEFDGMVLTWAQRSVRMLVPAGFNTPFKAIVGSRDDFVCRADFRSKVKQNRQGELYVYTYDLSADGTRAHLHLRSEASTVVIDQIREAQ
jgi:hypothetical protein